MSKAILSKITGITTTLNQVTIPPGHDFRVEGYLNMTNNTGALQLPTGGDSTRPSPAAPGYLRYNTDTPGLETYSLDADGEGNAGWITIPPKQAYTAPVAPEPSGPAGTQNDPFLYPDQLAADPNRGQDGTAWFQVAADGTARELRWVKGTHSGDTTESVWVLVYARNANAATLFTQNAVSAGSSATANYFKLSDAEVRYMTDSNNNPSRKGMAYFPAISSTTTATVNYALISQADANIWRHTSWATDSQGFPLGVFSSNAESLTPAVRASATTNFFGSAYPTTFSGQSDSNSYCGGTQVLSNWDDTNEDLWSARLNSANGCAYVGENTGTYTDPNAFSGNGDTASYLHLVFIS